MAKDLTEGILLRRLQVVGVCHRSGVEGFDLACSTPADGSQAPYASSSPQLVPCMPFAFSCEALVVLCRRGLCPVFA